MKKVLVVLLIAVLAVGSVFATVSGSVKAGYTFDFVDETASYDLGGGYSKIALTLVSDSGSSTGETKPYATATVNFALSAGALGGAYDTTDYSWTWHKDYGVFDSTALTTTATVGSETITVAKTLTAKFTLADFRIVGENWEVNFLKAKMFGNYAKSPWETFLKVSEDNGTKKYTPTAINYSNVPNAQKGVTVTYDDYKLGIYASSSNASTVFGVSTESKAVEFEGGSAQAAIDLGYTKAAGSDAELVLALSAKADYAVEDLTVAVAADGKLEGEDFNADVSATAAYKPATFDFYYATKIGNAPYKSYTDKEKILSVRAQFDVAKLIEAAKVAVTVKAENLLNDAKVLSAEAEVTAVENLALTVGFNDMLKKVSTKNQYLFAEVEFTGIENVTLGANAGYSFGNKAFDCGASAEYAAEKFTVDGEVSMAKEDGSDAVFFGRVGATTDVIVDNATLGADLVFNEKALSDDYKESNYLNVYCEVAF